MALIERTAYPRFAPRPSARELARLYTPTPRELDLARRATRDGEASGIPNQKVAHLAAQGRALDASELKKVGLERRRAMLVSLVHRAKIAARDGLAEMLVKTVVKAHARAKERLEDLHREKRATTEALVGVLEKILVGARDEGADDAAFGRRVRVPPRPRVLRSGIFCGAGSCRSIHALATL